MAYLVDTNILIHARDGTESVLRRFEDHDGAILLSPLSLAELHRGLKKNSVSGALRRARFDAVMQGASSAFRCRFCRGIWAAHRPKWLSSRTRFRPDDRRTSHCGARNIGDGERSRFSGYSAFSTGELG